jgi:hypothetical protein
MSEKPPHRRPQPAMSRASAESRWPARANHCSTRARTCCSTAARSSGVSAAASAKRICPSSAMANTPSITQRWKWTCAFNARPEALYKAHGPPAGARPAAALTQPRLDHPQQDVQHRAERLGIALHEVARPLGHRQHPLAHRQRRENHVHQLCCHVGHVSGVARGAYRAALAGKRREPDATAVVLEPARPTPARICAARCRVLRCAFLISSGLGGTGSSASDARTPNRGAVQTPGIHACPVHGEHCRPDRSGGQRWRRKWSFSVAGWPG